MIIVLDTYFKNSIGSVDVPIEFEPETIAILARYSAAETFSEVLQKGINKFIYQMKLYGIWDKIGIILLPCLASSIQEAAINAKTGNIPFNYRDGIGYDSSICYYNHLEFDDVKFGIKPKIGGTSSRTAINAALSTATNLHLGCYFMDEDDASENRIAMSIGYNQLFRHYTSKPAYLGVSTLYGDSNFATAECFSIINYDSNESVEKAKLCVNGLITSNSMGSSAASTIYFGTVAGNNPFIYGTKNSNYLEAKSAIGIMTTGSALTSNQLLQYNAIVHTLISLVKSER